MTAKLQNTRRWPKRQVIIETTVELFRQAHDVRKVSIEAIAATARVSPTTIYNQFGSREALVVAAAKSLIIDTLERSRAILHSDLLFAQKLAGVISGKLDLASKASDEVVAKVMSQDKSLAPFIEEIFRTEVKPLWLEMLAEGKRQGFIDPSVDGEAFLVYLDVVRAGFAARSDIMRDWKNNMDLIEKLTNLVFYGFLKKDIDLFGKKRCK
jgi:AcrR family transcriptional regulator